jgi:T-complex protein 1 subunit theta
MCVLQNGGLKDAKNVLDLLVTKKQAVQLVTDAVVTILRVDQIITAKPAGGPKMKHANQGHWDDT